MKNVFDLMQYENMIVSTERFNWFFQIDNVTQRIRPGTDNTDYWI